MISQSIWIPPGPGNGRMVFLIGSRDLEREGLAVLESGATIETDARNASHDEFDGQYATPLAARSMRQRLDAPGRFIVRKSPKAAPRSNAADEPHAP